MTAKKQRVEGGAGRDVGFFLPADKEVVGFIDESSYYGYAEFIEKLIVNVESGRKMIASKSESSLVFFEFAKARGVFSLKEDFVGALFVEAAKSVGIDAKSIDMMINKSGGV